MKRALVPLLFLIIAGLLLPATHRLRERPPVPPPAIRLFLTAPDGTELGVGDEPLDAAISPDQREVVFVATQARANSTNHASPGQTQLWRRRLDAEFAEPLAGTDGARLPAWKQTGSVLSFFADGRLKLLTLASGAIALAADAPAPAGATWLRDGSLLFVPGPGVVRRLLGGHVSDATRLAAGDTAHVFPLAVAVSQDFVYIAVRDGRRTVRLHHGETESDIGTTTAHAALIKAEHDTLLFVKDDALLADERDPESGRLGGRDVPVALRIGVTSSGRGLFTASSDVLIHSRAVERPRQLTWLAIDGTHTTTVADVGDYWQVRLSADDSRVAVTTRDPLLQSLDVLVFPVVGSASGMRLTASIAADSDPVWSPDARQLLFRSTQRGSPEVLVTPSVIDPNATDDPARPSGAAGDKPTDWRSHEVLIQKRGAAGFDLSRIDPVSGVTAVIAETPFNETDGRWSPDGRWIAYVSDEPGRPEIYVLAGGMRQRISSGGGSNPRWTRDSRSLLFLRGSTLMRADLDAAGIRFESPRPLFDVPGIRDFVVAHHSNRILALLPVQSEPASSVPVILNWRSLLTKDGQQRSRGKRDRIAPVL